MIIAFCSIGGLGKDKLYLLNMKRGKWEAPELELQFKAFYSSCCNKYKVRSCYIEDKASGTGLIQSLKRYGSIPVASCAKKH